MKLGISSRLFLMDFLYRYGESIMQNDQTNNYDVIIIGAGPAGLSAAHELAEKKLKVCVLEAAPFIGGKPISEFGHPWEPPKETFTATDLEKYLATDPKEAIAVTRKLPWEHGLRVYPENYCNLLDIMRRIPVEKEKSVSDYLTNAVTLANYSFDIEKNTTFSSRLLAKLEAAFFGLATFLPYLLTEKRALKYDDISVADLYNLKNRSPSLCDYIINITNPMTSGMVEKTSSLALSNTLLNYYFAPNQTGFRTFNRPTHLAWLIPWQNQLKKLGVEFHLNTKAIDFNFDGITETSFSNVKISEIIALHEGRKKIFQSKYIISAIPADELVSLMNKNNEMIRYDSRLIDIYKITSVFVTGIQLYYETPIHSFEKQGILGSMSTHPWGIGYADQATYWENPKEYAGNYGVVSVYLSVTNQVGRYIKKSVQKCTPNEIAYEIFTQVENDFSARRIQFPQRIGYFSHFYHSTTESDKDPTNYHLKGSINEDQIHLCITGMWQWRPAPETIYLGNLILCGAYTQNQTYFGSTMEAASESGRRGANTILKQFGLPPVTIHALPVPNYIRWLRQFDRFLFTVWLPNPLELLYKILRSTLKTHSIHMDPVLRKHENLHKR